MKLEFYFDVFSWTNQSNLGVFTTLCWGKGPDCKRYKVEVEVPDPNPVDMILKADAVEVKELPEIKGRCNRSAGGCINE